MSKALVLSGGGAVGIAWQTGLVAGLAAQGVDLRDADFVLGTSAGSAVGAQIALGRDMSAALERFARRGDDQRAERPARPTPAAGAPGAPPAGLSGLAAQMAKGAAAADPKQARAAIGRYALEATTGDEASFVRGFAYLAESSWPAAFRCTAVDAESGKFVVWDAAAGVDLAKAVASSCAVPGLFPPITLKGRRYMDGGMRTGTNADIAKGHERVLIISLMGGPPSGADTRADAAASPAPVRRPIASRELAALSDAGGRVEIISPDAEAAAIMGMDLMNPRLTHDAAQAGLRQGQARAESLRAFWA